LPIGYWLLAVVYWLLAVVYWLLPVVYWLLGLLFLLYFFVASKKKLFVILRPFFSVFVIRAQIGKRKVL
jgi:hypothetical protein